MEGGNPDLSKIFQIAKQVASQIEPPDEIKQGKQLSEADMASVISKITSSVSKVMTPDMITSVASSASSKESKMTKKQGKMKANVESKITFDECEPVEEDKEEVRVEKKEKKKRIVEIESESDSEDDPISQRTKDMTFTLAVTLEDLYSGTKKKLGIRRQKIDSDGSYQDEKKKLSIKIEPGMIDEQVIRFNKLADEKQGYETGDVVVCLDVEEHSDFVRDGNNLLIEKEISISEAFNPIIYLKHLDGKMYKIKGDKLDIFSDDDDMLKKVSGMGMPILGETGKFGDLFIRFKVINNVTITPEIIKTLSELFPPMQKVPESMSSDIVEKDFEMVTESDLEFFDSDEDSDEYSSDEEYSSSEEESD
jgi:DnaJ-class molecular chaperone